MNPPVRKSRIGTARSNALVLAACVLSLVAAGCDRRTGRQAGESATAKESSESTTANASDDQPVWLTLLISKFKLQGVTNPPRFVEQYRYRGQRVYYVPSECCDQMSTLYDSTGAVICAPDGGMVGKGDGRCTDFSETRQERKLIWKDSRSPSGTPKGS